MRLWSLHPKYLDQKGLVAAWREGLLALAVLQGRTTGYRHHPQLVRFQETKAPVRWMMVYLRCIYDESLARGYHFDRRKISFVKPAGSLVVTAGQLEYEMEHLKAKLKTRDPSKFRMLRTISVPDPHPLMKVVPGAVEKWEKTTKI
jgi:Pyrimidine dimer DNA glycosylase